MGLDYAGVDILEFETGPSVLEVNDAPGIEGWEKGLRNRLAAGFVGHLLGTGRDP